MEQQFIKLVEGSAMGITDMLNSGVSQTLTGTHGHDDNLRKSITERDPKKRYQIRFR